MVPIPARFRAWFGMSSRTDTVDETGHRRLNTRRVAGVTLLVIVSLTILFGFVAVPVSCCLFAYDVYKHAFEPAPEHSFLIWNRQSLDLNVYYVSPSDGREDRMGFLPACNIMQDIKHISLRKTVHLRFKDVSGNVVTDMDAEVTPPSKLTKNIAWVHVQVEPSYPGECGTSPGDGSQDQDLDQGH